MGAPEANTTNIYGIHLRESATDGSDFSNAAADYRVLFLGEDGSLHVKDSAGSVSDPFSSSGIAATIFDAQGDLIVASAADTAARLALGASGTSLRSNGTTAAWAFPPGHELSYVEYTSSVSVTATAEASADTVVTADAISFDGSTVALIEFFSPFVRPAATALASLTLWLYDGASSIGALGISQTPSANNANRPVHVSRRLTPSNASHTYSVRATVSTGTGTAGAGAGGAGNNMPGFIRITLK